MSRHPGLWGSPCDDMIIASPYGGDLIELVRYWEYERLSGFKHHGLPLLQASGAEAVVGELLAQEGSRRRSRRAVAFHYQN